MDVIIIGIGNTLVSDDGVGIHAVERLRQLIADERVSFARSERGGLDLLGLIEGYSRAFVLDAAWTCAIPPGTVSSFDLGYPFVPAPLPSLHTLNFCTLLAFGSAMGLRLPANVTVFTVEAEDIETFREGCSPTVESAISPLVDKVVSGLEYVLPDLVLSRLAPLKTNQTVHDSISMEFA